jgi:hypothetical protein
MRRTLFSVLPDGTLSQSLITELAGLGDKTWTSTRLTQHFEKQPPRFQNFRLPVALEELSLDLCFRYFFLSQSYLLA